MKLYEIINEIENFNFIIDEETGEILNAMQLDELELAKEEKIENICLFIKSLKAEAKAIKEEVANLQKRQKATQNKAESLEQYIQQALNGEKFKTARVSVSYRRSESIECEDILAVDDDYLRYKEPELDKAKIKAALKEGVAVKGCSLIQKQNMQIR